MNLIISTFQGGLWKHLHNFDTYFIKYLCVFIEQQYIIVDSITTIDTVAVVINELSFGHAHFELFVFNNDFRVLQKFINLSLT